MQKQVDWLRVCVRVCVFVLKEVVTPAPYWWRRRRRDLIGSLDEGQGKQGCSFAQFESRWFVRLLACLRNR